LIQACDRNPPVPGSCFDGQPAPTTVAALAWVAEQYAVRADALGLLLVGCRSVTMSSLRLPVPGALGNQYAAASPYSRSSGCDRLDRPPVTHRLDSEAASAATGDLQDAPSPDPKALHQDLREVTGPRQLEVAPAVLRKALAAE
jgi:hypothetical protein